MEAATFRPLWPISASFFPKERKGSALGLGLNASLGNLGVSSVQFLAPLVITIGMFGPLGGAPQIAQLSGTTGGPTQVWAQNAAFIWVSFTLVAALLISFAMHDIADAKASFKDQAVISILPPTLNGGACRAPGQAPDGCNLALTKLALRRAREESVFWQPRAMPETTPVSSVSSLHRYAADFC